MTTFITTHAGFNPPPIVLIDNRTLWTIVSGYTPPRPTSGRVIPRKSR